MRRSLLGFGGCFENLNCLDGEFHELFVRPVLASNRALAGQMRLLRAFNLELVKRLPRIHARIQAPTRLVWGTADGFFPLDRARGMLSEFKAGADLCEIPGGKLFVHEERAPEFAEATRPFLRNCFG